MAVDIRPVVTPVVNTFGRKWVYTRLDKIKGGHMLRSPTVRAIGAILVLAATSACDDNNNDNAFFDSSPEPAVEWPESDVTVGPLVSGTSSAIDGTFAWTDYVYDDLGPNTDIGDRTDMDSAGGDAKYAGGLSNAADFVQVQITDGDGGLRIRVVLETLLDPAVPLLGIAFDTDNDSATGAARLPGAWAPDGALGVELLVVLAQGAGEVLAWNNGQWASVADIDVTVDADDNTLDATLPASVATPGDATWNAIGVAGTASASWLTGAGVIHDLAFVADETFYQWQDYRQADILAGRLSVADAFVAIDFGQLASGATELPDLTATGFHTYLYHSTLELAEGIVVTADGQEFLGPYQPYLVYVPESGYQPDTAMTVFLHGLTQNHLGSVHVGDTYLGTGRVLSEEIGALEMYVRDGTNFPPHNLTVWPLARGAGLFYEGIAEQDVLDVLADASLRLKPDPDRIILSGASMGGIGTFRIGALYPDLWSVAVPIIGLARDTVEPLLTNYENLELLQINGLIDNLISADRAAATTDLLDSLGLRFRAWMLDQRGHEAGGFVYDCVYRDLPDYVRVNDPARVRYTVDPAMTVIDPGTGLELVHDSAYWVSGIAVADTAALGTIDAHSLALNQREIDEIARSDERYASDAAGRDLCGPNPDISTGDTWRERAIEWIFGDELPQENKLNVTLTNLAGASFDLYRAGLGGGVAASVQVTSDAAAEIVLTGLEPGQTVTTSGATITADTGGSVRIAVLAGNSSIEISES
jgi:predicted esterase